LLSTATQNERVLQETPWSSGNGVVSVPVAEAESVPPPVKHASTAATALADRSQRVLTNILSPGLPSTSSFNARDRSKLRTGVLLIGARRLSLRTAPGPPAFT
jgi:hypothetical protein